MTHQAHYTPQTQTFSPHRETSRSWDIIAFLIWFTVPILFIQKFHIAAFDVLILGSVAFFALVAVGRSRRSRRGPQSTYQWKLSNNRMLYNALALIVFAGITSAFNARSIKLCAFEVATFAYLLVMALSVDIFSKRDAVRFLKIGAVASTILVGIMGGFALLANFGVYKQDLFYLSSKGVTSHKFRGIMYTPNQWSGYILCVLPLGFSLLFEKVKSYIKIIFLVCCFLAVFSVPATASRSGLVLVLAQFFGFMVIYIITNRKAHPGKKLLFLVATGLLTLAGLSLFSYISNVWVFQRSLSGFELLFERGQVADGWRTINWNWAMTEYAKHPLLGIGFGNFELLYDRHEVHSSYLSLLTEGGPMAVLGYCIMLFGTLGRLVQTLLAQWSNKRSNIWTTGLIISLTGVIINSVTHSTIRNRHVVLLCVAGILYCDVVLLEIRTSLRTRRIARAQKMQQRFTRRSAYTAQS